MSEKRRRARIQGAWASSNKPASNNKHGASSSKTSSQPLHARDHCRSSRENQLNFQPTVEIKVKPEDWIIKQNGAHELSNTKNGVSRIVLKTDFIDAEECEWMFGQLLNEVPWNKESITIKGEKVLQPRMTAWFGELTYTYSGLTLNTYQLSPLLMILKERIEDFVKSFNRVSFNSVLANLYYNEKDSIDWHSDDESSLRENPSIVSLSFGETRMFEMRKKNEDGDQGDYTYSQHVKIPLPSGSLLVMDGATQKDWQHRVPKEYHDRKPRINLTFRKIYPDC